MSGLLASEIDKIVAKLKTAPDPEGTVSSLYDALVETRRRLRIDVNEGVAGDRANDIFDQHVAACMTDDQRKALHAEICPGGPPYDACHSRHTVERQLHADLYRAICADADVPFVQH